MKITVTHEIELTDQQAADILCTALEGGIGYWSQARNIRMRLVKPYSEYQLQMDEAYESCELAELNDAEDGYDWSKPLTLDYAVIAKGIAWILANPKLAHMHKGILSDIVEDSMGCHIDANVADCIVQAGLFQEIRYG